MLLIMLWQVLMCVVETMRDVSVLGSPQGHVQVDGEWSEARDYYFS
jgi:hypothetical protein